MASPSVTRFHIHSCSSSLGGVGIHLVEQDGKIVGTVGLCQSSDPSSFAGTAEWSHHILVGLGIGETCAKTCAKPHREVSIAARRTEWH